MIRKRKKEQTTELAVTPVCLPEDKPPLEPVVDSGPDTTPLELPRGEALPLGALLQQGRYTILTVVSEGTETNEYVAEADAEQRVCPSCGEARNRAEDRFCSTCGKELGDVPITRPIYLIKESMDPQRFQAETQVAQLGLDHPFIVRLRDAFSEAPYGDQQRHYLVMDSVEMAPLTGRPVPQEEGKVLSWGLQLAQALQYLHEHHVAHQGININSVLVDNGSACLTNFDVATVIPPAGWEKVAPRCYAEDLRSLVGVLYYLLTGQERLGAAPVPPAWARILNRAAGQPDMRYQAASELVADLQALLEDRQHPKSIAVRVGLQSDVGRMRTLNEDSLLVLELHQIRQSSSQPAGIYVVADGMGGHQGGEVASALAIQIIGDKLLGAVLGPAVRHEALADTIDVLLKDAVQAANQQIRDEGRSAANDMGTTAVTALLMDGQVHIANVGDSRAYLLDDHQIRQITVDHSLVQRLIEAGQITPSEAKSHPQHSAIYRVLGDKPRVDVDTFVHRLKPGERLLLCSDGLSGMVEDEMIHQLVITSPDPQTACAALVEAANAAGGTDNITVILVQVEAR